MKRFGTLTKLKSEAKSEYIKVHDEIWDEVVRVNDKYNFHNFTIFAYGDYLFSYYEYTGTDYDGDIKKKLAEPIIGKWCEMTGRCTEEVMDDVKTVRLEEIWHNDFVCEK